MNILALDPSLLHLGWAYMHLEQEEALKSEQSPRAQEIGQICVLVSGTIIAPKEYKDVDLVKRIAYCLEALHDLDVDVDTVVIEKPEQWGAYKSLASSKSDSLLKLNLLVGAIVGWSLRLALPENVKLIKVTTWKGQLPKHVTKKRMEKKYHRTFETHDEADAVGLGDWYLMKEVANES